MENYPKISIITPSFNQGAYLEQTILSVLNQNYPNLEYIIIDGGSTDNSVEIIKKYENKLAYWISEPDAGQSDAINKGLKKSTGYVFNWLGSDDFLESDALSKIGYYFKYPETTLVTGTTIIKNENNNSSELFKSVVQATVEKTIASPCFHQPSTYILTQYAKEFGGVPSNLHYAMDTDLYTKYLMKVGLKGLIILDDKISNFRIHQSSKTGTVHDKFIFDIASIFYSIAEQNGYSDYMSKILLICNRKPIRDYEFKYDFSTISKKSVETILVNYIFINILSKYNDNLFDDAKFLLDSLNIDLLQKGDYRIVKKIHLRLKLPAKLLSCIKMASNTLRLNSNAV